jgi:membrane associated rhomboid family serine protease
MLCWGGIGELNSFIARMAIGTRSYARGFLQSGGLPPGVKGLLIANVVIFLAQFLIPGDWQDTFALRPSAVFPGMQLWQLVTYMFLHGGIFHILFNMLGLWFLGKDLEETWGTDRFLKFFFFCGIGAGLCVVALNYLFGTPNVLTLGSSGAIYGIFLAAAMLWPDRQIIFYFVPLKLKYFVMILGAIAFLSSLRPASGVSDIAHLGGMLFGYLFLQMPGGHRSRRRGPGPVEKMRIAWKEYKLARARRKFQVYMKKRGTDERIQ